jgi:Tol biopolymer transport system component
MNSFARCLVASAVLLVVAPAWAPGREPKDTHAAVDRVLDSLFQVRAIKEVALAPDGKRIAWVEAVPGEKHAASSHTAIYLRSLNSSEKPRRITAGKPDAFHDEQGIAWSPDSSRLVFLSAHDKEGQH